MVADVTPGTQLAGRYVLGEPISQGGMGTVYRATDRRTGAVVAVKLPHPHLARDPSYRERLRREAQLAAALTSPRIVRVTDLGEHDGAPFLVMEYVSGETLEDGLRREGTLPALQAATIALEIARALEAAHALGIVHRDLKPQNIMLVEGRVKVLDFGVARAEGMAGLTLAGAFVGTPAYSAPERVGGGGDIRSDIYSLGVILFRLLAGTLPFEAHTPQALRHRAARAPSLPDAVPAPLRRIVDRCLALDPAARFETPTDLVAALAAVGVAGVASDAGDPAPAATLALPPTPVVTPPTKAPPPTNLPARLTSFVGRERVLADVAERLRTARLTTLTGAGGSGKTRLAIEAAASTLTHFDDGARLVELAPLTDPALVAPAVASVLGVREGRAQPAVEALVAYLRPRRLLLVLDNCEHLLDACASLADAILQVCPAVHILATSRQALGITGETVWHVPALEIPRAIDPPGAGRRPGSGSGSRQPLSARLRAADVAGNEAVRLFVERARAARADFALTDENALAVARVCQRLDGLPLAIELAAARVKVLSAEQLAVRLDDRFRLLTGGRASGIPHHQTLRATVTWSYGLLGDAERVVFDRLSVFAGGFTLDLAEAVVGGAIAGAASAGGDEIDPGDVLDLLTQLVDKSLVQLVAAESGQEETRFDLLETLREYAGERLAAAGTLGAVRERHAAAVLALAEAADAQLTGPVATTWLDRLDTEHDNLRAALRHYLQQAGETPGAATSALRLAGALARFWDRRGHLAEGRRLLEETIGLAPPDVDGALLARILNGAANLAHAQGDFRQASALHERALTLRRAAGDRRGIAASLYNLALAANEQGAFDRAAVLHAEALDLRRALGDTPGLILSLASLGLAAEMQGDDAQAAHLSRESLAIARELGDTRLIAYPLLILGRALYHLGQPVPALVSLEESRSLFSALGDVRWVAYTHRTLGDLALLDGDLVAARRHMQACLIRFRSIGEQWGVALALEGMGAIAGDSGRWTLAARLFGAAGALRRAINGPLAPASAARAEVERRAAAVRAALGDADFEAATAAGAAVDLDLIADVALEALGGAGFEAVGETGSGAA